MLDPVTAIGLASSIVAFVDFSAKLVKGSIEIYQASDGTLTENRSSQAVAVAMERFAARLVIQQPSQPSDEEKELVDLATKCHIVCIEILNLLRRIKPKDLSSKRQRLWAALKNKFHEGEREELEKRLDTYRRQLELHMSFKTMISLDTLSHYVRHNTESLNPLKATISELSAIGMDTQESVRQLLDIQKAALYANINNQILESLEHDDMDKRYEMIEEAHEKTFQWIFDLDGAARDDKAGSHFPAADDWDSVDTLDSNDSDRSADSSHGNQLVFASFFFWRPGSDDQKSLQGLYRSLLHSVLKHHLDLIPSIFPRAWREARESSWTTHMRIKPSREDISEAFELLLSSESICANHSFCFFVDGLDEYQTRTQDDHMDLVKRLESWTAAFPSNVKLCVSSREENPFMNSFSENQRLRLHTLTQYDIKAYVLERLPYAQSRRDIQALAKYIVKKASGVFFWVALVVRNIRRQWHLKLEPAELHEIVRGFPNELNDLYQHILNELDEYSRKRAFQTLAMIPFVTGLRHNIHLDSLAYSFLNNYNINERFARKDRFKTKLSEEQIQKRQQDARARLSGWCRGLVELDGEGYVGYAHRSVADFLEAEYVQKQLTASLQGTHPISILSELTLAKWKVQVSSGEPLSGGNPYDLVHLRQEHDLDHEPFDFLRTMDAVFEPELKSVDDFTLRGTIGVLAWRSYWKVAWRQLPVEPVRLVADRRGHAVHLSFVPLFFRYLGRNDYVLWSIENDPKTTDTASKAVLLFYASIVDPTYPVLDMLLKLNIIGPETRTHLVPYIGSFCFKKTYLSSTACERFSIWQHFLVREFYTWLYNEDYDVNRRFVGIVARFLRIGADYRFRFSILVVQWPTKAGVKPETEDTFTFGDPIEPETLSFRHKWEYSGNYSSDDLIENDDVVSGDCTFSKVRTWSFEPNGPRREISFTGWIRAMGDFPGKDDVLQLVEKSAHDWQSLTTSTTSGKIGGAVSLDAEPTVLSEKYITLNCLYLLAVMLGLISVIFSYSLCDKSPMIDHSLLHPTMTDAEILQGLAIAKKYGVATACVKPYAISMAKQELQGSDVLICPVIGFPHGNCSTAVKVFEADVATAVGGNEIDMVINIGKALGGDWNYVADEIRQVNNVVVKRGAILKVIFENDYLNKEHIVRLCKTCSDIGVAFVKTPTGYGFVKQENGMYSYKGATIPHLKIMVEESGKDVQVKAAGGVRTLDDLLHVMSLGVTRIGAIATVAIMEEAVKRGITDQPTTVTFKPMADSIFSPIGTKYPGLARDVCDIERPCTLCSRANVECITSESSRWRPYGSTSKEAATTSNSVRGQSGVTVGSVIESAWNSSSTVKLVEDFKAFQQHDTSSPEGVELSALRSETWAQYKATTEDFTNNIVQPHIAEWPKDIRLQQGNIRSKLSPAEKELMSLLPEVEPTTLLFDNYFDRIHWFILVFHQDDFRRRFQDFYNHSTISSGPDAPSTGIGFLAVLLAVFATSLQHIGTQESKLKSHNVDPKELEDRILASLKSRFLDIISKGSLEAVQFCVLLASYYLYHGEPGLAWPLSGSGLRIAQALNLHRKMTTEDHSDQVFNQQTQDRKRAWWAVYEIDTFCSMLYGFPLGFSDSDCNVEALDPYDEYSGSIKQLRQTRGQSLLFYKCSMSRLSAIVKSALVELYGTRHGDRKRKGDIKGLFNKVAALDRRLQEWQRSLDPKLSFVSHDSMSEVKVSNDRERAGQAFEDYLFRLQALSLKLAYENAKILVHRPLLSFKVTLLKDKSIVAAQSLDITKRLMCLVMTKASNDRLEAENLTSAYPELAQRDRTEIQCIDLPGECSGQTPMPPTADLISPPTMNNGSITDTLSMNFTDQDMNVCADTSLNDTLLEYEQASRLFTGDITYDPSDSILDNPFLEQNQGWIWSWNFLD
ncbi:hypothetical protein FPHYL_5955 [Fusarium phyllophilum]|uniref:deoxyribose-phosphate aldolase n=1 Tax=Fusarium phyllophilum TaxID=47803 RepID=A0A8H5JU30_9HYPO|nr:hypothetical protein FPHYL_5955 [Fusarium phyllophilum]